MQIEDVTPKALIAKPETIEAKVAEWSATDADLHAAVEATKGLTVKGHAEGPRKGREAVHKALMTLADCRVSIVKRREELKRPILDLGKLVDSEAKRLTAITAPREAELRTDRDAYDAEEAKAKAEAERIAREAKEAEERKAREEAQAILNAKVKRIAEAGGVPDLIWLAGAGDDEVESLVARLVKEKQDREAAAELERIEREKAEAEEAKRRDEQAKADEIARIERETREAEERKKLAEAREEQAKRDEEERIRQEEIAERNRAEAQRLADEREAFEIQQREAREAQERIDAARRRQEAEEQAKREAEAEAERIAAELAEAEADRAAQAPDREKVAAWAKVVRGSLAPCPVVDSPAVREQMLTARIAVEEVLNRLEREMLEG